MAKPTNGCGVGYCSRFTSREAIEKCQSEVMSGCNGLCAYQDGNPTDGMDMELTCCKAGCTMPAGQYIHWNSLCAYQQEVVDAAVAMYDGSGGGIGDLKRAAKEVIKRGRRYRIYKMMGDRHITDWPSLFKTADDAARWAARKDLAADLGLHEYLVVKDETLEKIVKYL